MKTLAISWKTIALLFGFAIIILLVLDFNRRVAELNSLTEERQRVGAKATQLNQMADSLEAQIATATSPGAVSTWVGDNGFGKPGEQLVIPIAPADSTPQPTPTILVTPITVTNWELWLSLFFSPIENSSSPLGNP